jgi:glycerol 2-dehydrogenase (NADP+)
MVEIDGFHKKPEMHRTLCYINKTVGETLFGWTFQQLGWDWKEDGFVNS